MSRRRRYPPQGKILAILTCRRIRERCLPHPSDELNEILIAFLSQARYRAPVLDICVTLVEGRGPLVPRWSRHLHAAAVGSTRRGGRPERSR